jgi:hypothetical protein
VLFCWENGKPPHPDTITRRFKKLAKQADLPNIDLHDMRHSYATAVDARVDPKIVADRIGHANMAYTLAIYTHKSTGRDRGAAETVAGVLLGAWWTCSNCKAAYIGTTPENVLCEACGGDDGAAGVPRTRLIRDRWLQFWLHRPVKTDKKRPRS